MAEPGRIARGADGADPLRRLYRRSPLRRWIKIGWDHRGLRPSDVMLASYPRSGSSWLRFLVLEMTGGDASFASIRRDTPYVGEHLRATPLAPGGGRLIKTHEPYLPVYRRAIHLVRDPRDVCVSYFGYMQRIEKIVLRPTDDAEASFDRFVDALLAGKVDAFGTWQSHLLSWTAAAASGSADVLRIRFEDLRSDPTGGVEQMAAWLGLALDRSAVERVVERCSLDRMQAAEAHALAVSPAVFAAGARRTGLRIVNSGSVEGWRSRLTDEQRRRFAVFAEGLALLGYPPA